ncbi:hypothetical protein AURDEDRAFT_175933 [Auricularia subglabra TFB-10046 SS5]|uniref:F-box domain-containing protein n=1 Tax=Auricularia subglabra (strain TFB-10046 / SS5) TaxID=717982 RepID=J0WQX1_AURST|nr:hypothetical protein AURDEDRAFT_175933 [Auricularia subglabra TFB-10046 SS5]
MPLLEKLELGPYLHFPKLQHINFPSLKYIATPYPIVGDPCDIFESSPALEELCISFMDDNMMLPYMQLIDLPRLVSLVSRVPRLGLMQLRRCALTRVLDIFAQPAVRELHVHCMEIDVTLVPLAVRILADVSAKGSTNLALSKSGDSLVLRAGNSARLGRILTLPCDAADAALAAVWRVIPPQSLSNLYTSWELWVCVFCDIARGSHVQEIELVLPEAGAPLAEPPDMPDVHFPRLSGLVLRAPAHSTRIAHVPWLWMRSLIRSLHLGRPLKELTLVNIEISDAEYPSPELSPDTHIQHVWELSLMH